MAALTVDVSARIGTFALDARFSLEGGTMAILGASGAGKTLTLRCIAGLMRPQAGSVVLGSRTLVDVAQGVWVPTRSRRIGYVFQQYALFPHMSVRDNLGYGLASWPRSEAQQRTDELVALLQLKGLEGQRPDQLSGGQQQRAALGRALAPGPELLLLDEPFSAVDTPTRAALTEQFQALQERLGFTAVLVTHDIEEAYALSSHLVVLDRGQVIQEGPREEVFHRPNSPAAARLLGMRNLLPGRAVSVDATGVVIDVEGVRLRAEWGGPGEEGVRPGTEVIVGIRQEQVVARPASADAGAGVGTTLTGALVQATDRGHRQLLRLHLRGDDGLGPELHVETGPAGAPQPGQWTVVVPPAAVHVWPVGNPSP